MFDWLVMQTCHPEQQVDPSFFLSSLIPRVHVERVDRAGREVYRPRGLVHRAAREKAKVLAKSKLMKANLAVGKESVTRQI
jgi:hypothetical protein